MNCRMCMLQSCESIRSKAMVFLKDMQHAKIYITVAIKFSALELHCCSSYILQSQGLCCSFIASFQQPNWLPNLQLSPWSYLTIQLYTFLLSFCLFSSKFTFPQVSQALLGVVCFCMINSFNTQGKVMEYMDTSKIMLILFIFFHKAFLSVLLTSPVPFSCCVHSNKWLVGSCNFNDPQANRSMHLTSTAMATTVTTTTAMTTNLQ